MKHTPKTIPVAYIEIPKGSRNKYEYDETYGTVVLDRTLRGSTHYPTDYGFLIDTLGEDGDPLDVLVLLTEPTFPGCLIPCDPVGVLHMHDEAGDDPKFLMIPHDDPSWSHNEHLSDINPNLLEEIAHFFSVYKDLEEHKTVTIGEWEDREVAEAMILAGRARFDAAQQASAGNATP